MLSPAQSREPFRIDERMRVEKSLSDPLAGLGLENPYLTVQKQTPPSIHWESFAEGLMLPMPREQIKVINDSLDDDHFEDAVNRLTVRFQRSILLKNHKSERDANTHG